MRANQSSSRLRYLDAGAIANPGMAFEEMPIETERGERLGLLDGVVIEPAAGRIRYLVVDTGGWWRRRCRLVPLTFAWVDRARGFLRVNLDGRRFQDCPGFLR